MRFFKPLVLKRSKERHAAAAEDSEYTSDGDTLMANPGSIGSLKQQESLAPITMYSSSSTTARRSSPQQTKTVYEICGAGLSSMRKAAELSGQNKHVITESLHYFWGSWFWIQVYVIVALAILCRQPLLLHGITLVVLSSMLDRVLAWGDFLGHSKETKTFFQYVAWMSGFALGELAKAMEGDTVRSAVASVSFNFWQGRGKSYLHKMMRNQVSGMNKGILKEAQERLDRQRMARRATGL